jgi:hypothetical protein
MQTFGVIVLPPQPHSTTSGRAPYGYPPQAAQAAPWFRGWRGQRRDVASAPCPWTVAKKRQPEGEDCCAALDT